MKLTDLEVRLGAAFLEKGITYGDNSSAAIGLDSNGWNCAVFRLFGYRSVSLES